LQDPEFTALIEALAAVYAAEPRPEGPRTAQALATTPAPSQFLPCPPPADDAAMRDLLAGSPHPAAQAVLAARHLLDWSVNPVADRMTDAAAAISAVATLMGPEGPIPAPDLRLGLLWQRAGSYYPLHNHDADETYVILAGEAVWTAGEDTRLRCAGEAIRLPSRRPGLPGAVALERRHQHALLQLPRGPGHHRRLTCRLRSARPAHMVARGFPTRAGCGPTPLATFTDIWKS
jgi:hypothetical protein